MTWPEERERIEIHLQEMERTSERSKAALRRAREQSEKYKRTLAVSGERIRSARYELRKAGYLR